MPETALAHHRPQRKTGLGGFEMEGRAAQHIVISPFNRPQNLQPAAAEQIQIERQFAVHHPDQRQPLLEQSPRVIHFSPHQSAKSRRGKSLGDRLVAHPKKFHIRLRNIHAPARKVFAHILPEICQLQRRASRIRKPEILLVDLAACVEHQPPHRVRRITAIVQHVLHGLRSASPSDPGEKPSANPQTAPWEWSTHGSSPPAPQTPDAAPVPS